MTKIDFKRVELEEQVRPKLVTEPYDGGELATRILQALATRKYSSYIPIYKLSLNAELGQKIE